MKQKLSFLKKKSFIFSAIGIVVILLVVLFISNGKNGEQVITVKSGDFINQVSVSGKVVAVDSVDLGFKSEGRIKYIYFGVGGTVLKAGTLIAQISATDAEKAVHDSEINLESAKLALAKIKLDKSDVNMDSDLQKAYDDGFTNVSNAFLDLPSMITGLDSLLADNNISDSASRNSGNTALDYRRQSEKLYYQSKKIFEDNRSNFRKLNRTSPKIEIENIINDTYNTVKVVADAINSTKNLADYLYEDTGEPSSFISLQNILSGYVSTINKHLSYLLSSKTSIKNYKDAFSGTDLNIKDALLLIKQKENALQDARNKLEDYYIRAPFDGIVTKMDANVGEIASPNTPLVTMMGDGAFQIESYLPEVNIASIKLGNDAKVTLDAYGDSVKFNTKVIFIDPAETIRDGVSTYKVKFQFENKDERIKSGMTANVSIIIFSQPNVISIPAGVVFDKDGKKFVQLKIKENKEDREVILGKVSSLGRTEVISGLNDGDIVVLDPLNLK